MKEPLEAKNFDTVHQLCGPLGLKRSMLVFVALKFVLSILGVFLAIFQIILMSFCDDYTYLDPGVKNLTPMSKNFVILFIFGDFLNDFFLFLDSFLYSSYNI